MVSSALDAWAGRAVTFQSNRVTVAPGAIQRCGTGAPCCLQPCAHHGPPLFGNVHELLLDKRIAHLFGAFFALARLGAIIFCAKDSVRYPLIGWAKQLGRNDCANLLEKNLEEEKAADRKDRGTGCRRSALTDLATLAPARSPLHTKTLFGRIVDAGHRVAGALDAAGLLRKVRAH